VPRDALIALWKDVTGTDVGEVAFEGREHPLPGPYRVGTAAATCVAATTLAAAELVRERHGNPPPVTVHIGHAAEAFRSERHLKVAGEDAGRLWTGLSGDYEAADGWVKLHANYPHHADAILRALGTDADGVPAAVARRTAVEVEDAVLAAGGAAAAMRDRAGWLADGPGAVVGAEPLVAIERIGDAPPRPLPRLDRSRAARILAEQALADRSGHLLAEWTPAEVALTGVRVLDLTHVIAGPVATRTLAAHGADVLHVTDPVRPVLHRLVMDTDFGKRSCHVDAGTPAGRDTLTGLAERADVFVQSYRPDSLARKGFGAEQLVERNPGIVVVDLAAYGHTGPWRERRGFDSLVQMSCGIAAEQGMDRPRPLPAQALDHGTGWLAAFGVLTALRRRATEGGSWRVRLSLARTAEWLHDLGRDTTPHTRVDVRPFLAETPSDYGRLTHLRVPGAQVSLAGPHRPGHDPAAW
jgi:crotonobetainyl-CoA:carnitine CoA-transferase CaiB-like acyl-CoA transferase